MFCTVSNNDITLQVKLSEWLTNCQWQSLIVNMKMMTTTIALYVCIYISILSIWQCTQQIDSPFWLSVINQKAYCNLQLYINRLVLATYSQPHWKPTTIAAVVQYGGNVTLLQMWQFLSVWRLQPCICLPILPDITHYRWSITYMLLIGLVRSCLVTLVMLIAIHLNFFACYFHFHFF